MIVIVGSYNVGLFLKGDRLPEGGETVIADSFFESGGGKGSNQALAAAAMGAPVRFVGCIGEDKYGRDALELYARRGINSDLVRTDPAMHTGISIILIDGAGRNMISVAPGANLNLTPANIDACESSLRAAGRVGFQLENRPETVFHGLRRCHEWGVSTFLDPAPAVRLPEDLYPCIDLIKPNETEATVLTGIEVTDQASAIRAGRWLRERGVGRALVTLGAQGSVLVGPEGEVHFSTPKVNAVDTTGAGDTFAGALLARLDAGVALPDAIHFASAAAAISTTRIGVVDAIPTAAAVEAFLNSGTLPPSI